MEVIACGTKVAVTFNHDCDGIVTAILIRYNNVVYEVSYFNNGEYKQIWLTSDEFKIVYGEKKTIGFK